MFSEAKSKRLMIVKTVFVMMQLGGRSRERKVPGTRIGRLVSFGSQLKSSYEVLTHTSIYIYHLNEEQTCVFLPFMKTAIEVIFEHHHEVA